MTTHEIEVKDCDFWKVSTSTYGGLRFKTKDKDQAIKQYAERISANRVTFTVEEVRKMSGFKAIKVRDKSRCLKQSQLMNSVVS